MFSLFKRFSKLIEVFLYFQRRLNYFQVQNKNPIFLNLFSQKHNLGIKNPKIRDYLLQLKIFFCNQVNVILMCYIIVIFHWIRPLVTI